MADKKKQIIKVIATILAVVLLFVGSFGGYLLYRFNCDKSDSNNDYNAVYSQPVPSVTLTKIDVTADNAKDMYAFEQITA